MRKPNSTKDLGSKSKTTTESYPVNERWALVVGVSEYEYKGISSLQFSHRDAEQFAQLLKMPSCGSFPENNVKLLTNQKATLSEVQKALRSFLSLPTENDFVIIYFSGHGSPDPKRLGQHYLFTYDTNPDDIAGTALPMREIRACVAETLLANRVMVIVDACHSGALLNVKSGNIGAELLNNSLKQLTSLKKSLAWLTSSQAYQVSIEDAELRHGVFTYYLLRGLEGAASGFPNKPEKNDSYVTIKELFDYVEFHVKEHTKLAQSPTPGPGSFDPNFRLAFTGEAQSKDYFEVGQLAMNLGEQLLDQERFEAAAYYFDRSYELSRALGHNYAAKLLKVRSLIACKQLKAAIEELNFLIILLKKEDKTDIIEVLGEALYLLGIAHLIDGKNSAAAHTCLQELMNYCPEHKYVSTLNHLLKMQSPHQPKLFLVLVGMNDSGEGHIKLSGAINDIEAIEQALFRRWKDKREIVVLKLINAEATKANISIAFEKVKAEAGPLDMFFFHFSGLGPNYHFFTGEKTVDVVIKCYGKKTENTDLNQLLTAEEFHQLMTTIPCIQKNVAIDTSATYDIVPLIENEPTYNLFYAASPGQYAYEIDIGKKRMGLFSKALADALENSSQRNFWEDTISFMRGYNKRQEPLLIGNSDSFFDLNSFSFSAMLSKIFSLAEIPTYSDLLLLQRFFNHDSFFPELHYRLVRYFEYYGKYEMACNMVNTQLLSDFHIKPLYPLIIKTYYKNKWHQKAMSLLAKFQEESNDQNIQKIRENYARQLKNKAHVLIVGISNGTEELANQLQAHQKLSGHIAEIGMLIGQEASAENIVSAFKKLVIKSKKNPVLFVFSGPGAAVFLKNNEEDLKPNGLYKKSDSQSNWNPGLFSSDHLVIPLSLFQDLTRTGEPNNIITILDLGMNARADWFQANPSIQLYTRKKNNTKWVAPDFKIDFEPQLPLIGATTIIPGNITPNFGWVQTCKVNADGQGIFTQHLILALKNLPASSLKIKEIINWIKFQKVNYGDGHLHPRIYGNENKLFLSPDPDMSKEIEEIAQNELRRTRDTLSKFEADPRALIELAYVQHLLDDSEGAVRSLESVKDKAEVHYPLGRILTESAQDNKEKWSYAVRELLSVDTHNHPAATYYLGKAILGLIRVEKETEAELLWQEYAKLGFPIGNRTEVEEYLNARDPEKQIKVSLYKAKNFENELKITEALQEFEKAAKLGSIEAIEAQIWIYMAQKDWEKAFALANEVLTTGIPRDNLRVQMLTIVPNLLANSKYLNFIAQELESKLSSLSEEEKGEVATINAQLKWLEEYKTFTKDNPLINTR